MFDEQWIKKTSKALTLGGFFQKTFWAAKFRVRLICGSSLCRCLSIHGESHTFFLIKILLISWGAAYLQRVWRTTFIQGSNTHLRYLAGVNSLQQTRIFCKKKNILNFLGPLFSWWWQEMELSSQECCKSLLVNDKNVHTVCCHLVVHLIWDLSRVICFWHVCTCYSPDSATVTITLNYSKYYYKQLWKQFWFSLLQFSKL